MKTLILNLFFHQRCLSALIVLIAICISCPQCGVSAQTTTWTSSHPAIVSVDANGTIKMISLTTAPTDVTITAKTIQNGETVTSAKTVNVNPFFPGCTDAAVNVNGLWWSVCSVGTTVSSQQGSWCAWANRE